MQTQKKIILIKKNKFDIRIKRLSILILKIEFKMISIIALQTTKIRKKIQAQSHFFGNIIVSWVQNCSPAIYYVIITWFQNYVIKGKNFSEIT